MKIVVHFVLSAPYKITRNPYLFGSDHAPQYTKTISVVLISGRMNQTNSSNTKLLFISFYYKVILYKNFHAGLGTSEVIGHYCSMTFISYIPIRMNII